MAQLSFSLILRELQTNTCKFNGSLAGNLVGAVMLLAAGVIPSDASMRTAYLVGSSFVALCSRATVDSVKRLYILLEEVEAISYGQAGAAIASEFTHVREPVAVAAIAPATAMPSASSGRSPIHQPVGDVFAQSMPQIESVRRDFDWIHPFIFGDNDHPPNFHINLIGPTQIGKSTLGEHFMTLQATAAQTPIEAVYLLNPKHKVADPDWSFPPYCNSIDDALQALQDFKLILKNRQSDPTFTAKTHGLIYFVIDDWDWIFEEYKAKALSELRALIKVGAGLNIRVLLCGQSPLCRDTGLSGSDFKQMGRVILGREAIDFLGGKQFPFAEMRESLYHQAKKLFVANARFALVVPMRALPFVGQIPDIEKGMLALSSQPDSLVTPKFSEDEIEQILRWLSQQKQSINSSDLTGKFPQLNQETACFLIERASEEGLGKVGGEFPDLIFLPDRTTHTESLAVALPMVNSPPHLTPVSEKDSHQSHQSHHPIPEGWKYPDPKLFPDGVVWGVLIDCIRQEWSQTRTIQEVWGVSKGGNNPSYDAAKSWYQLALAMLKPEEENGRS